MSRPKSTEQPKGLTSDDQQETDAELMAFIPGLAADSRMATRDVQSMVSYGIRDTAALTFLAELTNVGYRPESVIAAARVLEQQESGKVPDWEELTRRLHKRMGAKRMGEWAEWAQRSAEALKEFAKPEIETKTPDGESDDPVPPAPDKSFRAALRKLAGIEGAELLMRFTGPPFHVSPARLVPAAKELFWEREDI